MERVNAVLTGIIALAIIIVIVKTGLVETANRFQGNYEQCVIDNVSNGNQEAAMNCKKILELDPKHKK